MSAGNLSRTALRAKAALIRAQTNGGVVISRKNNLERERERGKVTY